MADNERTLTRDLDCTVIPSGDAVQLPEGTTVTVTHRLGGNFTVVCDFGMFRISGEDADAIGEEVPEEAKKSKQQADTPHEGPPKMDDLWEKIKTVYDPEIPVNIVDLGLVYSLDIKEKDDDKYDVEMAMTLTAPGCGMGPAIAEDARARLCEVPGVNEANVEIVWDPPWHQDMISEEGKMQLGLI